MAEAPSHQSPSSTQTRSDTVSDSDPLQYWCYHCDKRVSIETLADLPDVICHECKNGFVESISATALPPSRTSDQIDEASLGGQFLQVLRLIAQAARDENAPHPPPSELADPSSEDDYLRIELNGWDNDDDDDDDDDDDENGNDNEVRDEGEEGNEGGFRIQLDGWDNNEEEEEEEEDDVEVRIGEDENEGDRSDEQNDENENREYEEEVIRRRRDILRLQLRDFASRRNRILDWAEILMGLEDHSIELRLQVPEMDDYVGNPEDYVDAAGYEALLQNLAESDGGGRRGAPPAAKLAILSLPSVEIKTKEEAFVCSVCKDSVNVGELVKKLPCGHGYHGDCIVPWLGSRNSCPVCRFELPTDDPDYEEDRKKKRTTATTGGGGAGVASSSGNED